MIGLPEEKADTVAQARCIQCGSKGVWRVFYSRDLMQCHACGAEYKLSELVGVTPIKHQR